MTVTWTEKFASFTPSGTGWQNYDIYTNQSVPKGAIALIVCALAAGDDVDATLGVRTDGSILDRYLNVCEAEAGGASTLEMFVKVDATTGYIETYCNSTTGVTFYLLGYFTGVTFTEAIQSLGATSGWYSYSLDGYTVEIGRVGQFAIANTQSGAATTVGMRRYGSSLERTIVLHESEAYSVNYYHWYSMCVRIESNSGLPYVDGYMSTYPGGAFKYLGYFGPEMNYVEKISTRSATGTDTTWTDWDVSSLTDGVLYNIISQSMMEDLFTGHNLRAGQRLTLSNTSIKTIKIHLARNGVPPGSYYVRVRKVSDDSVMGELGPFTATDLSPSGGLVTFTFTTPLAVNEEVRILVEYSEGNINNCVWVMFGLAGDIGSKTIYTTSYTDDATYDLTGNFLSGTYGNAVCDLVLTHQDGTAENNLGARQKGSSLERYILEHEAESNGFTGFECPTESDSSGIIQVYATDISETGYNLMGYFKDAGVTYTDGSKNRKSFLISKQSTSKLRKTFVSLQKTTSVTRKTFVVLQIGMTSSSLTRKTQLLVQQTTTTQRKMFLTIRRTESLARKSITVVQITGIKFKKSFVQVRQTYSIERKCFVEVRNQSTSIKKTIFTLRRTEIVIEKSVVTLRQTTTIDRKTVFYLPVKIDRKTIVTIRLTAETSRKTVFIVSQEVVILRRSTFFISFKDGFETIDFSKWTGTAIDSGMVLEVEGSKPHHGDYDAKMVYDSANYPNLNAYAYKTFNTDWIIHVRIELETLSAMSAYWFHMIGLWASSMGSYNHSIVLGPNSELVQYWRLDSGYQNYVMSGVYLTPNSHHSLEIKSKRGNGDGEYRVYLDGVEIPAFTHTGLTNTNVVDEVVVLGSVPWWSGTGTGTVWYDCIKVAKEYIGPEPEYYITRKSTFSLPTTQTRKSTFWIRWKDDFESGDFSKWTSYSGDITVVDGTGHHGKGAHAHLGGNCYKQFPTMDEFDFRFYVKWLSNPSAVAWIAHGLCYVVLKNDNGTLKWGLLTLNEYGEFVYDFFDTPNPVAGNQYSVETHWKRNTVNGVELYINDSLIGTCSCKTYDESGNHVYLWAEIENIEATYDCAVVSNVHIGMEPEGSTTKKSVFTVRQTQSVSCKSVVTIRRTESVDRKTYFIPSHSDVTVRKTTTTIRAVAITEQKAIITIRRLSTIQRKTYFEPAQLETVSYKTVFTIRQIATAQKKTLFFVRHWKTGWNHRKLYIVRETPNAGTNYQVPIKIFYKDITQFSSVSHRWTTISGNPTDRHAFSPIHRTNIVEANKTVDGAVRKYLAYDSNVAGSLIRLYYSDTIEGEWTAYSGNPILGPSANHYRYPSVVEDSGTFHMFLTDRTDGNLERWTSSDGITFNYVETVLSGGSEWKNPFAWLNPNDNNWYLYYHDVADTVEQVKVRSASTIAGLTSATSSLVVEHLAAPSVHYAQGLYWLLGEVLTGGLKWTCDAYVSTSPTSGFTKTDDSPFLVNDEAIPLALFTPDQKHLYIFVSRDVNNWYQDTREVYNNVVSLNGKCRPNFSDIRITDSDGTTDLNYYLEEPVNGSYVIAWVKIPNDLASTQYLNIYYGNSEAQSSSNGTNTFNLFSDFNDLTGWTQESGYDGSVSVSNSILTLRVNPTSNSYARVYAGSYGNGYALRYKANYPTPTLYYYRAIGFDDLTGTSPHWKSVQANNKAHLAQFDDTYEWLITKDGAVATTWTFDLTNNAFKTFEIRRATGVAIGLEEFNKTIVSTTNISTASMLVVFSQETGTPSSQYDILVDWTFVRKYITVEPPGYCYTEETADGSKTFADDRKTTFVVRQTIASNKKTFFELSRSITRKTILTVCTTINRKSFFKSKQPFLSDWRYRLSITIDGSTISEDLTWFPLGLKLCSTSGKYSQDLTPVFDEVGSNSKKIALTKSDGTTQLYVEIEKWDATNEVAWVWVSKSDLVIKAGVDTTLFVYFDKDKPDNTTYVGDIGSTPGQNVWNSSFLAVWHMKDATSTTVADSTSNGKTLSKPQGAGKPVEVDSLVGKGQDYTTSTADYLRVVPEWLTQTKGTLEIFAHIDIIEYEKALLSYFNGWSDYIYWWVAADDSKVHFALSAGGTLDIGIISDTTITPGAWYHLAVTQSSTVSKMFINGTQQTATDSGEWFSHYAATGTVFDIGWLYTYNSWDGVIDEFRVSDVDRSQEWLETTKETLTDQLFGFGEIEDYATYRDRKTSFEIRQTKSLDRQTVITVQQTITVLAKSVLTVKRIDTELRKSITTVQNIGEKLTKILVVLRQTRQDNRKTILTSRQINSSERKSWFNVQVTQTILRKAFFTPKYETSVIRKTFFNLYGSVVRKTSFAVLQAATYLPRKTIVQIKNIGYDLRKSIVTLQVTTSQLYKTIFIPRRTSAIVRKSIVSIQQTVEQSRLTTVTLRHTIELLRTSVFNVRQTIVKDRLSFFNIRQTTSIVQKAIFTVKNSSSSNRLSIFSSRQTVIIPRKSTVTIRNVTSTLYKTYLTLRQTTLLVRSSLFIIKALSSLDRKTALKVRQTQSVLSKLVVTIRNVSELLRTSILQVRGLKVKSIKSILSIRQTTSLDRTTIFIARQTFISTRKSSLDIRVTSTVTRKTILIPLRTSSMIRKTLFIVSSGVLRKSIISILQAATYKSRKTTITVKNVVSKLRLSTLNIKTVDTVLRKTFFVPLKTNMAIRKSVVLLRQTLTIGYKTLFLNRFTTIVQRKSVLTSRLQVVEVYKTVFNIKVTTDKLRKTIATLRQIVFVTRKSVLLIRTLSSSSRKTVLLGRRITTVQRKSILSIRNLASVTRKTLFRLPVKINRKTVVTVRQAAVYTSRKTFLTVKNIGSIIRKTLLTIRTTTIQLRKTSFVPLRTNTKLRKSLSYVRQTSVINRLTSFRIQVTVASLRLTTVKLRQTLTVLRLSNFKIRQTTSKQCKTVLVICQLVTVNRKTVFASRQTVALLHKSLVTLRQTFSLLRTSVVISRRQASALRKAFFIPRRTTVKDRKTVFKLYGRIVRKIVVTFRQAAVYATRKVIVRIRNVISVNRKSTVLIRVTTAKQRKTWFVPLRTVSKLRKTLVLLRQTSAVFRKTLVILRHTAQQLRKIQFTIRVTTSVSRKSSVLLRTTTSVNRKSKLTIRNISTKIRKSTYLIRWTIEKQRKELFIPRYTSFVQRKSTVIVRNVFATNRKSLVVIRALRTKVRKSISNIRVTTYELRRTSFVVRQTITLLTKSVFIVRGLHISDTKHTVTVRALRHAFYKSTIFVTFPDIRFRKSVLMVVNGASISRKSVLSVPQRYLSRKQLFIIRPALLLGKVDDNEQILHSLEDFETVRSIIRDTKTKRN